MKHIIFLNGPPRCGKDTVGKFIVQTLLERNPHISAGTFKFADPLRDIVRALLGKDIDIEQAKENPLLQVRELMIKVSEGVVKPMYGQSVFGVHCANRIKREGCDVAVITDAGFSAEIKSCVIELGSEWTPWLYNIYRRGTNFDSDSRSYIEGHKIMNDGDLYDLMRTAANLEAVDVILREYSNA